MYQQLLLRLLLRPYIHTTYHHTHVHTCLAATILLKRERVATASATTDMTTLEMSEEDRKGHFKVFPWETACNPGLGNVYRHLVRENPSLAPTSLGISRTTSRFTACANGGMCRSLGRGSSRVRGKKHVDIALFGCDGCCHSKSKGGLRLLCWECTSESLHCSPCSMVLCEECVQKQQQLPTPMVISSRKRKATDDAAAADKMPAQARSAIILCSYAWNLHMFMDYAEIDYDQDTFMGGIVPLLEAATSSSSSNPEKWNLSSLLNDRELKAKFYHGISQVFGPAGDARFVLYS